MAYLPLLYSRDTYNGGWGGAFTGNARWAFFAVFIVLIIIVAFATVRANKKRSRIGVAPIYGTRWMTPPSYHQSQNQSGENTQRGPDIPSSYVPAYSAEATDLDMGYYDNMGKFHANPRANDPNTPAPERAHQHTASTDTPAAPATNLSNTVSDEDNDTRRQNHNTFFNRPPGPPPSSLTANADFAPPPGPPPGHPQTGNSADLLRSDSTNADTMPTILGEKNTVKVSQEPR